jgi:hypothetical protein
MLTAVWYAPGRTAVVVCEVPGMFAVHRNFTAYW